MFGYAALFAMTPAPSEALSHVKMAVSVGLLAIFWCWETWQPFFGQREGRFQHAGRNLAIALVNTAILALLFGFVLTGVANWTEENRLGLLNALDCTEPLRAGLALILLDAWMYSWHRANHHIPFLWRFHRMHHSDRHMDVTTATRFHLGEHLWATALRLGLVPLLGFQVYHLLIYDTLVIAVTQFHHADISVGRWDRWLRLILVTPDMHKVHHSEWRPETDSNYATVLSIWDRVAGSYRMRRDPSTLVYGLNEFAAPTWQTCWGMLKTPFGSVHRAACPLPDEPNTPADETMGMASQLR